MRFHPYADIFPMLDGEEFQALVSDIKTRGLLNAIWVIEDDDGQTSILDGRNRYRACLAAGVDPRFARYDGDDPLGFVIAMNLVRRHLTVGQLSVVALRIEEIEAEAAAMRRRATLRQGAEIPVTANLRERDKGEAAEKAALAVGVSPRSVQTAKKLKVERPDLLKEVGAGRMSLHEADRKAAEDKRAENLRRPPAAILPTGIHHGDFRELSAAIPDGSIDLVFTDPPYDRASIGLYSDAAKVAARILKPGGSMLAYAGQVALPEALASMARHLRYWWTCACVHDGGNPMMRHYGIRAGWKPILWFVKDYRGDVANVIVDTVRGDREKCTHEWQQSQADALHFIEKLCPPGGTVVDFFLGGGTTAVAAIALNRKFIAYEIDAASIERAAERIAV